MTNNVVLAAMIANVPALEKTVKTLLKQNAMDSGRRAEARAKNANAKIEQEIRHLEGILSRALSHSLLFDFSSLRVPPNYPEPDFSGLEQAEPEPRLEDFLPPPLSFSEQFVLWMRRRHKERSARAPADLEFERTAWKARESRRISKLETTRAAYQDARAKAAEAHESTLRKITDLERGCKAHEAAAIRTIFTHIFDEEVERLRPLLRSARVAYDSADKKLLIELYSAPFAIIPVTESVRNVKSSNAMNKKPRPMADRRRLYNSMIAQLVLRALYVAFLNDRFLAFDAVIVSCFSKDTDARTGQLVEPCLLSVVVTPDQWSHIVLKRVDSVRCLRALNARVSPQPDELQPVKPIVTFNMMDPRFVSSSDVLSGLDSRPNLADLTPGEFEALMTNLFEKMGLETRLTRASRDGGVDCVAWDLRPIVGGKVVVQAKRYKNTVGVSAVRDLYGTLMNEGAGKGILVTTSAFGKAAYEFANNKPLELITGTNLLYLLKEHAGIDAKIEFPDEWVDPQPD
jgi:restriction system protein